MKDLANRALYLGAALLFSAWSVRIAFDTIRPFAPLLVIAVLAFGLFKLQRR